MMPNLVTDKKKRLKFMWKNSVFSVFLNLARVSNYLKLLDEGVLHKMRTTMEKNIAFGVHNLSCNMPVGNPVPPSVG